MYLKFNTLVYKCALAFVLFSMLFVGEAILPILLSSDSSYQAAYAQAAQKKKKRRTPTMRERVFRKIGEAEELINAQDYQGAKKILDSLLSDTSLNAIENGQTWNYYGYIYASQDNYDKAIEAYKNVLKHGNKISEALEQSALMTLAQIYLSTEKFDLSISMLNRYLALTGPNPTAYEYLAQAYFQKESYKQAIKYADNAIKIIKQQNGRPKEQLYLILRAGYYEMNNYPKVISVLEELVTFYPKGEYFSNLGAMYGEQNDEARQLAVYEAAYDSGLLTRERDLIAVASLLLQNDVPHKAATILEKGMKEKKVKESVPNLKLLSAAWYSAQEPKKSVKALSKAAEEDEGGDLFAQLANSYAALENWKMAVKSVNKAFKKGDVKNPGSAYVTLGLALFNMDDLDGSIKAFEKALKYKKIEAYAKQMINYLEREKKRRQRIANSLS